MSLTKLLSDIRKEVTAAQHPAASDQLHDLQPSDSVLIKNFRRNSVTHTAGTRWVHISDCRKIPEPENTQNNSLQQLVTATASRHLLTSVDRPVLECMLNSDLQHGIPFIYYGYCGMRGCGMFIFVNVCSCFSYSVC